MPEASPSTLRTATVLAALALAVLATIGFIRSRATQRLSIEDKANLSALAHRICTSAAARECPLEWDGGSRGFARLPPQAGRPLASREQVRSALGATGWTESRPRDAWSFDNGKYGVSLVPASGAIVLAPL
jgi:hypothetical protein